MQVSNENCAVIEKEIESASLNNMVVFFSTLTSSPGVYDLELMLQKHGVNNLSKTLLHKYVLI